MNNFVIKEISNLHWNQSLMNKEENLLCYNFTWRNFNWFISFNNGITIKTVYLIISGHLPYAWHSLLYMIFELIFHITE